MFTKNRSSYFKLLYLLIFPVLGLIYTWLNTTATDAITLGSAIDDRIPFIPIFIVPYAIWYAYILFFLVYFCFKDSSVYFRTLFTITAGEIICFFFYVFWQTSVPRPDLEVTGIITGMVQYIYTHDEPFNCFPSIHVLTTYAVMSGAIQIKNKHKMHHWLIQGIGTLIILSTLFVKQHVLLDVAASMILASVLYSLSTQFSIQRILNLFKFHRVPKSTQSKSKQIK